MINVKEIWIGEKVRVISSGRIGTYEGISKKKGKIRVRSGDKIYIASAKNVELYNEVDQNDLNLEEEELTQVQDIPSELDLHINVLAPHLEHANPIQILDFQIRKAKEFLALAYEKRKYSVTLIHGKGTGQLRNEVLHLLKENPTVQFYKEVNNGGAQEVLFNY